ncbi:hypothetical protein BD560DRAFT_382348, partial [Blakeslea trispora]
DTVSLVVPAISIFFFSSSSSFSSALSPLVSRATSIQSFILQLDPQLSDAVCLLTKHAIPVTESLSVFRVCLPCLSLQSTLRLTS